MTLSWPEKIFHDTSSMFAAILLNLYRCLSYGAVKEILVKMVHVRVSVDGRFGYGRFGHGRFGHGRFGQIHIQSMMFWPNTISTRKEASYELFSLLYIVYVKQNHRQLF